MLPAWKKAKGDTEESTRWDSMMGVHPGIIVCKSFGQ